MSVTLLEALRSIPDHRRAEGKRFDLATVLLYAVLGMVAGANSYRQMHEFIRIHLQRLNEAFGLRLPYSPSYTGLRLIILGVDPAALEAAFRRHAASTSSSTTPATIMPGPSRTGSNSQAGASSCTSCRPTART
jgi:hypothetical protein